MKKIHILLLSQLNKYPSVSKALQNNTPHVYYRKYISHKIPSVSFMSNKSETKFLTF